MSAGRGPLGAGEGSGAGALSPFRRPGAPGAFEAVVRRRRMTRAFEADRPVERATVDRLVDLARRAPAAGNTDGLRFVVLDQPVDVAALWERTLPPERRDAFPWPGLLAAPVLILPCVSAEAYVARYAEADKAGRRAASPAARRALGDAPEAWPMPYWLVDGGMAVMTLLLAAEDAGLGALFFGLFEHEAAVAAALGVPGGWRLLGALALGHAAPPAEQRPSASARRPRPPLDRVLHRGRWPASAAAPPTDRGQPDGDQPDGGGGPVPSHRK